MAGVDGLVPFTPFLPFAPFTAPMPDGVLFGGGGGGGLAGFPAGEGAPLAANVLFLLRAAMRSANVVY